MKGIADTGFLVAFLNRRDKHHAWAVQQAGNMETPLLTCEAVLAEAAHLVKSTHAVLALVETGLVTVGFDMESALPRMQKLAARYADRAPDLADICLICLSEEYPGHEVVTTDLTDFQVYRRRERERIPTRMPG